MKKTYTTIEHKGYKGSAVISIAINDVLAKNKICSGDRPVPVSSGLGYSQAATAFVMP